VYIDNNWVAQQYIERSKKGSWKKENTKEALKFGILSTSLMQSNKGGTFQMS
jgi:hypothetical protein